MPVIVLGAAVVAAGGRETPRAEVAARSGPAARVQPPDDERPGADDARAEALAYFRLRDHEGDAVRHVTDVWQSGDYLRVYTDLGEGDVNARPALRLCGWAARFLTDGGEETPRVFVHGHSRDDGAIVLANRRTATDDCRVD
ncbi:hypothetical protein [Actinomadura flavalba]|uniref:hypothetical protein n=1 Tax=Actinomadura flavalba TaxID=1120938 RepID=UPI0012DC0406|nr:hypothetical protein [Actinomadura flavalba]